MRVVVTRPQADGERTAAALRARGHDVLLAPLMRVEPVAADLRRHWGGVIITSANAPRAIARHPARAALLQAAALRGRPAQRRGGARRPALPRSHRPDGDVRDLVRLIAARQRRCAAPLLYLAGEDRAADLVGELAARGIAAEMAVVYRAVTAAVSRRADRGAAKRGEVEAVLHFSRRSAENYLAGAQSGRASPTAALEPCAIICLSAQVAAPLAAAGAAMSPSRRARTRPR